MKSLLNTLIQSLMLNIRPRWKMNWMRLRMGKILISMPSQPLKTSLNHCLIRQTRKWKKLNQRRQVKNVLNVVVTWSSVKDAMESLLLVQIILNVNISKKILMTELVSQLVRLVQSVVHQWFINVDVMVNLKLVRTIQPANISRRSHVKVMN